jgi:hypothetical protein
MFLPKEQPAPLVSQPTAAPIRKLQFGIWGGVIVAMLIAGITAYDQGLAAIWVPVISAVAGSLGVIVPAYQAKSRAP